MSDESFDSEPRPFDPADRVQQKFEEIRTHAELAAIFEGVRKADAKIVAGLDPELARSLQRGVGKLEKAKIPETPVVGAESADEARAILNTPSTNDLSTNDYHIHRRPGEVMIIRWLAGEEVEVFYERYQAHFDAALNGFRGEERANHEWKNDEKLTTYLKMLDAIEVKVEERYLREYIRKNNLNVLSTQTADEINIEFLAGHVMGLSPAQVVGAAAAPPDPATERDLAWFFKIFALRGMVEGEEKMCFFTYLQKTDDDFDFGE